MSRFYGEVKAEKGLLLGGTKRHISSYFDTRKEATRWTEVIVQGNQEAGRKVGKTTVIERSDQ